MIRLKDIMKELYISGAHLPVWDLLDMLEDSLPDNLRDKAIGTGKNAPKLSIFLKWMKSKQIASSGDLIVIRTRNSDGWDGVENRYFLIDTSQEKFDKAAVGSITTKDTEKEFSSIKLGGMYKLKGEEVHWSGIVKEHQGKGYGKVLYDAVLDYANVLFSDSELHKGSYAMWKYHMSKNAFFGAVMEPDITWDIDDDKIFKLIVPIDTSLLDNTIWASKAISNFIVVKDRSVLPKVVRLLEYNTRGIDITKEFKLMQSHYRFVLSGQFSHIMTTKKGNIVLTTRKPEENEMQFFTSVERLPKQYTIEDYLDNFTSIEHLIKSLRDDENELVSIKHIPNADKIKLLIFIMSNAALILKNKSDGISVQIIG